MGITVMYSIFGPPKTIRILSKILQENGFVVRPTKLNEYILVRRDPWSYIPENIRKAIKLTEFEGSYYDFLRDANVVKDLLAPVKFRPGEPVSIVDGPYKDFNGIIRAEKPDNLFMIDISVWGKIVTALVQGEHLAKRVIQI
jgi:transcription antitermination factor NusG